MHALCNRTRPDDPGTNIDWLPSLVRTLTAAGALAPRARNFCGLTVNDPGKPIAPPLTVHLSPSVLRTTTLSRVTCLEQSRIVAILNRKEK